MVVEIKLDVTQRIQPYQELRKQLTGIIHNFSKVCFHFWKTMCLELFRIMLTKY